MLVSNWFTNIKCIHCIGLLLHLPYSYCVIVWSLWLTIKSHLWFFVSLVMGDRVALQGWKRRHRDNNMTTCPATSEAFPVQVLSQRLPHWPSNNPTKTAQQTRFVDPMYIGSMMDRRRRRWANIETTLAYVCDGPYNVPLKTWPTKCWLQKLRQAVKKIHFSCQKFIFSLRYLH